MKKHLIAAAVAAAFAVPAMAQVTVSGKLRFAYEDADKNSAGATTAATGEAAQSSAGKLQGLRVTDGDFRLTATEDLGGGMRATAYMEVQSRGRGTGIAGRDAAIMLSGGFGSVLIGAVEAANGIEPLAAAGAPGFGDLDSNNFGYNVLRGAGNADLFQYTTPELAKGLTFRAAIVDQVIGRGGLESASTVQDASVIGFNYTGGPLTVAGDYTTWGNNAATPSASTSDSRTRISGNYNLGVARIGLGYETRKFGNAAKDNQSMVGVSVPLGALTLGLTYAEAKLTGTAKRSGIDGGLNYALSKRTFAGVHYLRSEDKNATTVGTDTRFRIQLGHSF